MFINLLGKDLVLVVKSKTNAQKIVSTKFRASNKYEYRLGMKEIKNSREIIFIKSPQISKLPVTQSK
jgi:hypothetical protein